MPPVVVPPVEAVVAHRRRGHLVGSGGGGRGGGGAVVAAAPLLVHLAALLAAVAVLGDLGGLVTEVLVLLAVSKQREVLHTVLICVSASKQWKEDRGRKEEASRAYNCAVLLSVLRLSP